MVQSNSIGSSFYNAFGVKPMVVGVVIALVAAFIFIGGINRIARVTEKVVPLMALIYIVGCLIILFMNLEGTGRAFMTFLWQPLTPKQFLEVRRVLPYRKPCVSVWQEVCFPMKLVWVPRLTPMQLQM